MDTPSPAKLELKVALWYESNTKNILDKIETSKFKIIIFKPLMTPNNFLLFF